MNRVNKGQFEVNHASDNQAMIEVKEGKVEKLAILFERYQVSLYNFFLRLTGNRGSSEDLVQEVFLRILKYRRTYQGTSTFTVWMYQIARNAHIDYLRKKKEEIPLEEQWAEVEDRELAPAEEMEQKQDIALVRKALAKLPVKKREILILSRFQNLKHREIAELFGCDTGTVKATVHRATKELGKIYFELSGGMVS
jgi:RNA polymerase sigma-70 factor (ECF subfamily)